MGGKGMSAVIMMACFWELDIPKKKRAVEAGGCFRRGPVFREGRREAFSENGSCALAVPS